MCKKMYSPYDLLPQSDTEMAEMLLFAEVGRVRMNCMREADVCFHLASVHTHTHTPRSLENWPLKLQPFFLVSFLPALINS